MKKILFLAPGNSIHSYKWINYFRDKYDVTWVSFHPFHDFGPGKDVRIDLSSQNILVRCRKLLGIIKDVSPDLIHVHSLGIHSVLGLFSFDCPMVATAWGSDILLNKSSLLRRFLLKKVIGKSSLVTCDAEHMIDEIKELSPESEVELIMFGVDTDFFKKVPVETEPDSFEIVSLRNLDEIYDIPTLISAFPIIKEKYPSTTLKIYATGPLEDRLKEQAKNSGESESIQFMGRFDQDSLPAILSSATVYVSCSLSDAGIAASTAEAMACELPVVVSDVCDNAEWVSDGCGLLFEAKDSEDLAAKVMELFSDRNKANEYGKNGRRKIVEENSLESEMGKMHQLYLGVIDAQ